MRVALLIAVMTLIGGLTPVMARLAVSEFPPLTAAWFRFSLASVLLFLTTRMLRGRPAFRRRHVPRILLLAVLAVPINQIGFLVGVRLANATHAGLLYALAPIVVFWASVALRLAHFTRRMAVASLLAFAGAVVVVATSADQPGEIVAFESRTLLGDLLLLLAVSSWALFVVLSKELLSEYGPLRTLSAVLLVGCLLHLPLISLDIGDFRYDQLTWRGVTGLGFITVVTAYLNYILWFTALTRIEATKVAIAANAAPIVTVVTAHLALGEPVSAWIALGTALVVSGILLATQRRAPPAMRPS